MEAAACWTAKLGTVWPRLRKLAPSCPRPEAPPRGTDPHGVPRRRVRYERVHAASLTGAPAGRPTTRQGDQPRIRFTPWGWQALGRNKPPTGTVDTERGLRPLALLWPLSPVPQGRGKG